MICVLSMHSIVSSFAFFNLSNTIGCGSAQHTACRKTGDRKYPDASVDLPNGNRNGKELRIARCEILGMRFNFQTAMGMRIKSLKWGGGFGTKIMFPHISSNLTFLSFPFFPLFFSLHTLLSFISRSFLLHLPNSAASVRSAPSPSAVQVSGTRFLLTSGTFILPRLFAKL